MFYFIMEDGNGAYVEAQSNADPLWNPNTCIEVPKKPDIWYYWNNTSKIWEESLGSKQDWIRPIRNNELSRTDKYVLEDYPLTAEEKAGTLIYRQQLRDVPDKLTPAEIEMPACPPYLEYIP